MTRAEPRWRPSTAQRRFVTFARFRDPLRQPPPDMQPGAARSGGLTTTIRPMPTTRLRPLLFVSLLTTAACLRKVDEDGPAGSGRSGAAAGDGEDAAHQIRYRAPAAP